MTLLHAIPVSSLDIQKKQGKEYLLNRLAQQRIVATIVIACLFWVLESIVMVSIFQERTFVQQLLHPTPHDLWQRLFVIAFIVTFSLSLHIVTRRRDQAEQALAESEERYRTVVESVNHAIFIVNRSGLFNFVNKRAAWYFGCEPQEITGHHVHSFLPATIADTMLADIFTVLDTNEALSVERLWALRKQIYWFELTIQPLRNGSEPDAVIVTGRDVTERNRSEEEERQRNQELAILNTIAATVNQSLDLNQILHNALNEVLKLKMFGNKAKGMILLLDEQKNMLSLAAHQGVLAEHPCLHASVRVGECLCGLAVMQKQAVISEDSLNDGRHVRSWPGMPRHKDVCLPIKARGNVLGAMNVRLAAEHELTKRDISLLGAVTDQIGTAVENAQLFKAVKQQQEQLRVLAARVSEVEEGERRKLASELHDQVGQSLTALGINLHIIRSALPDTSRVLSNVEESFLLVEMTTDAIRGVMAELRPPMLDDYGLVATLSWLGDQLSVRTGLAISVRSQNSDRHVASPAVEIAFFRIAQEALNNVAKHAEAAHVAITLEKENGMLRMTIADDGTGFDPQTLGEPEADHGWGHLIMAERAQAVGGHCRIESHPLHNGTHVIVEVA